MPPDNKQWVQPFAEKESDNAMLLTLDIGNSYITLGVFNDKKLVFVSEIWTENRKTRDQYACEIKQIMALHGTAETDIHGAVISSVVPELTDTIKKAVNILTGVTPLVLGPGVKTGLNILIDNPAQLGADLAACAVAAVHMGRLPCIIYDLGTTSTISIIDKKGRFIGVVIAAGVGTTLEMFTSRTALLPHVSIDAPKSVIGKNTAASMQSGLIYGTASMLDGLAGRIEEELGERAYILATGGRAGQIAPHCRKKTHVSEYLLLEGLRIIYEKNIGRKHTDEA